MAICYDRLFHLMIDKKISNAQLKEKAGFSANIITRLKRQRVCFHRKHREDLSRDGVWRGRYSGVCSGRKISMNFDKVV